jgi:hypothetical protein
MASLSSSPFRRAVDIRNAAYDRLELYCAEHGMAMSDVVEAMLEELPRPTQEVLLGLERAGRVERCGRNEHGEQLWKVR